MRRWNHGDNTSSAVYSWNAQQPRRDVNNRSGGGNMNSNSPNSDPPIRDNIRATTNDNTHVTNDPDNDGVGNEAEVEEDVVDVDIADDDVVKEDRSDGSETIISKTIAETIVLSCNIHKENAC